MNKLSAREAAIARRVKRERQRQGLSQSDMAKALGLSQAGYGHYDRARQPFTVDQLFQLSRILSCSAESLLGLDAELTEDELQLLTNFRNAPDDASRRILLEVSRSVAKEE